MTNEYEDKNYGEHNIRKIQSIYCAIAHGEIKTDSEQDEIKRENSSVIKSLV